MKDNSIIIHLVHLDQGRTITCNEPNKYSIIIHTQNDLSQVIHRTSDMIRDTSYIISFNFTKTYGNLTETFCSNVFKVPVFILYHL